MRWRANDGPAWRPVADLTTARGTRRGERLPPPAPPPAAPEPKPEAPARGRPAIKVGGISTDKEQRARLQARVVELEQELAEANLVETAGTIEGQTLVAGLTARVWSLRSLLVTDIHTRARCDQSADMARTQLVRLEKAQHAARAKRLVAIVEQQQTAAAALVRLKG